METDEQPKQLRQVSITCNIEAEDAVIDLMDRELGQIPSVFAVPERNETKVSVYLEDVDAWDEGVRRKLQKGLESIEE